MIDVDLSETLRLEADLSRVAGRVVPAVEAVVARAALNIKNGMVADAESGGHYKHFAGSITYDRTYGNLTEIAYEIGPDKNRRQGDLGNILYFGTSKNAPELNLEGPVQAEGPRFLTELRKAAGDVL